jgi:2-haloacid dehalogenase
MPNAYPKAVLFDLLTALLNSWSLWNACAGSPDAGRAWRAEYLKLTYGCGAYVPYEALTRQAAHNVGLTDAASEALENRWLELQPWSGAIDALAKLKPHCKLAIVTNCSTRLGRQAASIFPLEWDAVVTAEDAGFYKPDAHPYRLALQQLNVDAHDAAFVAGSSYDMFGTAAVGLRTFWHNRAQLAPVEGAPAPEVVSTTLDPLDAWLQRFA